MKEKNEDIEQPIPDEWRSIIVDIVDDIRNHTLGPKIALGHNVDIDPVVVDLIYKVVNAYGDPLVALPSKAWQTSICRWMGGYWYLLIDLFTIDEGLSDLVLIVDVSESQTSCRFEIQSVYVP